MLLGLLLLDIVVVLLAFGVVFVAIPNPPNFVRIGLTVAAAVVAVTIPSFLKLQAAGAEIFFHSCLRLSLYVALLIVLCVIVYYYPDYWAWTERERLMPDSALIALIPFCIPVLIITHAWARNSQAKISNAANETTPAKPETPKETAFHQAEFTSLKSEVTELVKATASNFQYAVLSSAGVFTWIATANKVDVHISPIAGELKRYSVWIPFMLSGLFFSLSAAQYIRLIEIGKYLLKLEDRFCLQGLGWQKAFSGHPGTLGPIYLYGWSVLLIGYWLLAVYLLAHWWTQYI